MRAATASAVVLVAATGCAGNEISVGTATTASLPQRSRLPDPGRPGSTAPPADPGGSTPTSAPQSAPTSSPPGPGQGGVDPSPRPLPSGPTTTESPDAGSLPGLWISLGTSINDERGTQYARARSGQRLIDPVDDGAGGVIYLRCVDQSPNCRIELVSEPGGPATDLGEAVRLLAVGTSAERRTLLVVWRDATVTPNSGADVSGLFGRAIDIDGAIVFATYNWYGSESGPVVGDVEQDQFVLCTGEGVTCVLSLRSGDGAAPVQPFVDVGSVAASSAALDSEGRIVTWVATDPGDGSTTVNVRTMATGATTSVELLAAGEARPTDTDTDGEWVALLVGERAQLRQIAGRTRRGQLVMPPGVLSIALRTPAGGGASGPNPL